MDRPKRIERGCPVPPVLPSSSRSWSEITSRHIRRGVKVITRVTTGPHVGDDERVDLQVQLVCAGR